MRRGLFYISCIILLSSCAQIKAPTGGPKDEEPPRDSLSFPANGSVNFNVNSFTIRFNEFVQLNNLNQKLLVSPLMDNPDVSIKGKKMIVKIQDTLRPNTTYTLNFGDAIEDITEKNKLENYRYVFSTGSYLDSIKYQGVVYNALSLEPEPDVFVMLYDRTEDSIPRTVRPYYVSKTNKDGVYSIENIRAGRYKVFVLKDNNNNYMFDLPNEPIAFKDSLLDLSEDLLGQVFRLFEEDNEKQYLFSYDVKEHGKMQFVFNKPVQDFSLDPLNFSFKKDWFVKEQGVVGDTISLWATGVVGIDTLKLKVCDGDACDTVQFKTWTEDVSDKPLTTSCNAAVPSFPYFATVRWKSSAPLKSVNASFVEVVEDSVKADAKLVQVENTNRRVELGLRLKEDSRYEIMVLPGALEDIFGRKNDTLRYNFKTKKADQYGAILLDVTPEDSLPYSLELFLESKFIGRTTGKGPTKYDFSNLNPGNYSVFMKVDQNGDGVWTTGDYEDKMQPEKVIRYTGKIEVKPNWEQDLKWNLAPEEVIIPE